MPTLTPASHDVRMVLDAKRAADVMTSNPVSIRQDRSVAEAAAFFALRGIGAAPVIDEAGRPVGVVSRTDVLHHYGLAQQRRDAWRDGVLLGVITAWDVLRQLEPVREDSDCTPDG